LTILFQEISVFPQKNATVREILEEARQQFRFTPNGSGKLRLTPKLQKHI
jgi:hypothetical protein